MFILNLNNFVGNLLVNWLIMVREYPHGWPHDCEHSPTSYNRPAWASAWTPLHLWRWSSSTYEGTWCRSIGWGEKFSNSPRKGGYYGVHISHLDIPKKGKPCFFPPGPWCRGWTRNMEFPNGVPLVSLGKARVTVDASTPPPPYRWCPEPGAWRCQVWSVPVFGDMETPENTMENRWKTCGKHTYLNS